MGEGWTAGRRRQAAIAGGALLLCLLTGALIGQRAETVNASDRAALGEARRGAMTVELPASLTNVEVTEARAPGRPLVVIDPGHGGRDPGATGVVGGIKEKNLTLLVARELRAELARRGRVRIALTRDGDASLDLNGRAEIARQLGADLFISLHADSSTDPKARGATVYSLSDVASDADAARMAAAQGGSGSVSSVADGSVRALLADLAARDAMTGSADFAVRLLDRTSGRVELRPEPHRFAAFRVLRRTGAPAVLFEMGYLSSSEDETMLLDSAARARMVAALARAIEAELALARR
jgi:N-acetylmuramoyl-L-alanine amidase